MDSGNTATYLYDAAGRRVGRQVGTGSNGVVTYYVYGADGQIICELNTNSQWLTTFPRFGGNLIAQYVGTGTYFYHQDHLGSTRLVTAYPWVIATQSVLEHLDYLPFGEQLTGDNAIAFKFTGKERDSETGNDAFGARYYSNRFGRWLSSDWSSVPAPIPYANLTNPQTLNLYAMVADDPESFADLDGHVSTGVLYPGSGYVAALGCEEHPDSCETTQAQAAATQTLNQENARQSQRAAQNNNPEQPQGNQPNQPNQPNQEKKQDQEKDQQKTPLDAGSGSGGGRQPRGGERGKTSKPESWKHTRPSPDHPGQYEVQDHQTGKWVLKPKGWKPATQRVILGVEVGITAYVIYRVVRMLPSLLPPLWETIPVNAAIP